MTNKKTITIVIALIILIAGATALFKIFNKEEATSGKLPGDICTLEYAPVCGVNGITYGNRCMAGNMEIAYEGECSSNSASGTYPAGEVPENLSDEDLASS